jgi:hypothetical protein
MSLVAPIVKSLVSPVVVSLLGGGGGGSSAISAEAALDAALQAESDSGDFVAWLKLTDLTTITKSGGGNPSVGEGISGATIANAYDTDATTAGTGPTILDEFDQTATIDFSGQPNLVTNGTFDADSDWIKGASVTISGGVMSYPSAGSGQTSYQGNLGLTINRWYRVRVHVANLSGTLRVHLANSATNADYTLSDGWNTFYIRAESDRVSFRNAGTTTADIDNVSVQEVPASFRVPYVSTNGTDDSLTSALPARENQFQQTENLSDAAWSKRDCTITSTTIEDPDGGSTAFELTPSGTDAAFWQQTIAVTSATNTFSIWLKVPSGSVDVSLVALDNGAGTISSNQSAITITDTWQRFEAPFTSSASSSADWRVYIGGFNTWSAGEVIHVWHPHLNPGSTATDYQRITSDWLADMMVCIAFRTSADQAVIISGEDGNKWLGVFDDGSTTTLQASEASFSSARLDGLAFSPANWDAAHTEISDGAVHIKVFRGADISAWSQVQLGYHSSTFRLAGDIFGLIIAPDTDENLALAEAALEATLKRVDASYALAS